MQMVRYIVLKSGVKAQAPSSYSVLRSLSMGSGFDHLPLSSFWEKKMSAFFVPVMPFTTAWEAAGLAAVPAWMVRLPPLMKRKHLASSKVCDGEMQNYRGATDIVYSFMQECCEKSDTWVTGKMLHDRFKCFCESNSLSYTLTPQRFYEKLKNLRVKRDNRHNQVHFQLGLI